jgi:hypothetical protein
MLFRFIRIIFKIFCSDDLPNTTLRFGTYYCSDDIPVVVETMDFTEFEACNSQSFPDLLFLGDSPC